MGRKLVKELEKPPAEIECHHHWVIEFPDGPTSMGICQRCGAKREFMNHIEYSRWEDDDGPESQSFATPDIDPELGTS